MLEYYCYPVHVIQLTVCRSESYANVTNSRGKNVAVKKAGKGIVCITMGASNATAKQHP